MGHNGISAVYDGGIVPALIEHAGIDAQNSGKIDRSVQCALIGADDYQVIFIYDQILLGI